jgi:hypothetical protein
MKKLSSLLLVISLGFSICNAQEKYLSITGGYTAPIGNFAESDLSNSESGYAQNGYNFSFEMSFYFNDYFGLGANLRFNNCDFNSGLFNELLKEKFANEVDTINLTSGNYNLHNFLFGPYVKVDLGDYVAIYAKTFFGVMSSYRPDQTLDYRYIDETDLTTKSITGKYTGSFAYNFGAGALFKISSRFGLNISADYIAGNPTFQSYNTENFEFADRKQQIAYFNYNAGVLLTF